MVTIKPSMQKPRMIKARASMQRPRRNLASKPVDGIKIRDERLRRRGFYW